MDRRAEYRRTSAMTSLHPSGSTPQLVAAAYIAHIPENHALSWRRWWWPGDERRVVSVVNGATVTPQAGWSYSNERFHPSETFILSDGLLRSAMTAYEDYLNHPER